MKVAWLFPGQGSQVVGMGKALAEASPAARDVYARVDATLADEPTFTGQLSRLCFEGPEAELTLTANTQPAIVATSIALLAALRERLGDALSPPVSAAGHSLGEYAALVAGGALSVEDACVVVHRRGRAMQEAVPAGVGAMAAVMGADAAVVEEVCREAAAATGEVVSPANFNAPGQIVIAGGAAAVKKAGELVGARKGKAIPLKVSAPFHCALMTPAAEVVRAALGAITVAAPRFPVVANVDASPRTEPAAIVEALVQQVASPVRWQASIEAMVASGVTHALEIGPGKVLAGLCKRIAPGLRVHNVSDLAGIEAVPAFFSTEQA